MMTLTDLLVPTYAQMLRALSTWLDKAVEQRPLAEAEALLSARLAGDMHPLSSQISFACYQAQEATYRLRGLALPEELNALVLAGQKAGDIPGSLSDAQTRIAEALSSLGALAGDALDAGENLPIVLELPNGMIFDMVGERYARDWAIPQFYFHLMTAYAILRNQGIDVGKADYVQHAAAYLRPGTLPE